MTSSAKTISGHANMRSEHNFRGVCSPDVHIYTHTMRRPTFLGNGRACVFMSEFTNKLYKKLPMNFPTFGRFKLDKSPIVGTTMPAVSTTYDDKRDTHFNFSTGK